MAQVDVWLSRAASPFRSGLADDWPDVQQEVRLEVFNLLRAGSFRGESRLKTYVWRVCAHTCLDALRRKRRQPVHEPESDAEPLPATDPSPLDALLAGERQGRLLEALEAMSAECRALWGLIAEGLSYREISQRLGVGEGALRVRAHRCRKRVAEALAGNEDGEA